MIKLLTRLLKEPLVQFLILGAAIYGAYALFGAAEEDYRAKIIRVDSNRIDSMLSEWQLRWNRPPSRQEIDGLIQQYINEDVLYQQAVAMGLDEDDPVMRRRMAQKLEFLTSDLSAMQEPEVGELEQFFTENRETYQEPDKISFSHIFFDPDKRRETTLIDAESTLARLKQQGKPGEEISQMGDRLMLQNVFNSATELDISRQLGTEFAEEVVAMEPGQWQGPVLSGYGVHLVYVYEHFAAPSPVFEEVQAYVLDEWHRQKREQFNADFLASLKSGYKIVIDEIPVGRLLDVQLDKAGKEAQVGSSGEGDPNL